MGRNSDVYHSGLLDYKNQENQFTKIKSPNDQESSKKIFRKLPRINLLCKIEIRVRETNVREKKKRDKREKRQNAK